MKYLCPLVNRATGERRDVLVHLTTDEVQDVDRHLALRGVSGPGGPNGPIARGYACRRATQDGPKGFVIVIEQVQPVTVN
jgi:hypothetical protein